MFIENFWPWFQILKIGKKNYVCAKVQITSDIAVLKNVSILGVKEQKYSI